jgi:hypothetical protein
MAKETSQHKKQDSTGETTPGTDVDRNAGAANGGAEAESHAGAIAMLEQDHRKVEGLFGQFERSSDNLEKERLVGQICEELILHMRLEEDIFYPACRGVGVDLDTMDETQVEHDGAKVLLNDLLRGHSGEKFWEAKVSVLKEMIEHHVAEEEKPGGGAFAQATAHGIDDSGIAAQLRSRKQELQRRAAGKQPIRAVSLHQEEGMPRYGYPDRDERGRFMSDDDRDYGRSRYRDHDDSRYGNGGRGRGHGGWYGDSEGHSEAARSRSSEGRYGGRYADDDRYGDSERYSRGDYGRYGDDDRSGRERDERGRFISDDDDHRYGRRYADDRSDRERDERGRFMSDDDDRYARRSHYDDDDRRDNGRGRGHGGWFGDSEGHSRAARSRDDDDRRHSRHDDDDDRRYGHGGWFGDPRGHAEASRRGWQHRR